LATLLINKLFYPGKKIIIPDDAKIVSKYKKEHAHEWIDILGKGDYVIQEDDSEWSEKEHITDILEIDE
jgi:hypothetical protein